MADWRMQEEGRGLLLYYTTPDGWSAEGPQLSGGSPSSTEEGFCWLEMHENNQLSVKYKVDI